ncbi:Putative Dol-P-Glc:Glc(2)Man(9)GlcNAc(2)-PP-Dol alpha-1, 2-glucosyltransferase, partial [Sarcoptes scabiei]
SLNRSSFLNNAETDSSAKSRWIVEKRSESLTKMLSTKRSLIYFSFLLECFAIAFWFNKTQPNEFIDEQFHWNQTKAYCGGNFFEWNEKITTPPGLYLISYVFSKLISLLGFDADRCESLNLLRSINIIFSIGNLILFRNYFHYFFKITSSIKFSSPASSKNIDLQSLLSSLSVVHLPPLFFFTFLFYTDIGSIFFIILTYYMAIVRERHWIATFSGFISLLFRQTNIVWLFFIAASSSIDISILHYVQHSEYGKNHFRILNKSIYFPPFECRFSNPKYFICFITDLIISICWANIGYLANAFIFLIFLFINKGDRNAHQSVLHLAQIPYYLTFSFIFAWPLILNYSNLIKVFNQIISRPTLIIVCTIFLVICLCPVFKYEHPYLLADNRHYVFYLWRKFWFRKDYAWFRYLPLPFYLLTLISIWNLAHFPSINEFKRPLKFLRFDAENFKKILFFISLIITIVPQSLIEFRYFLTPFVIWRLNVRLAAEVNHKNSLQVIELVWFLILNLLTFFIFHFKTFQHLDGSIQRIIW